VGTFCREPIVMDELPGIAVAFALAFAMITLRVVLGV
jgi:hypothetical protein